MAEASILHPEIFGAYDIRGIYPETLDDTAAYAVGRALVHFLASSEVAVGRDMRLSSPALAASVMKGITDEGATAIDLGLTTTDELYFAVGKFGYPAGIMITASHNPARYNGMKLCSADAVPLSADTGIAEIREIAVSGRFCCTDCLLSRHSPDARCRSNR